MSINLVGWAMKQRLGSATLKIVLVALANYADESGAAWPSQATLAGDTDLTDRSVRTALAELEARGLITRAKRYVDGKRLTDRFTIVVCAASVPEGRSGRTVPETPSGTQTLPEALSPHPTGSSFRAYRKDVPDLPERASDRTVTEPSDEPSKEAPLVASSDARASGGMIDEAISLWNETADRAGLPKARVINPARRQALRARLAECGGLDGWRFALAKAEASSFCCGRSSSGWRLDLSAMLQPKTFTRLIEGGYDDRKATGTNGFNGTSPGHRSGEARGGAAVLAAMADFAHRRGLSYPDRGADVEPGPGDACIEDADWRDADGDGGPLFAARGHGGGRA